MGNWSPYSEEWERQRIKKFIEENDTARKEFEKKPCLYKMTVRLWETVKYYGSLLTIHFRMLIDREYRKEMKQITNDLEEKVFITIVNVVKEDGNDRM